VPVSCRLREIEETIWRRVCQQPGFMAPEKQCSGRSRPAQRRPPAFRYSRNGC